MVFSFQLALVWLCVLLLVFLSSFTLLVFMGLLNICRYARNSWFRSFRFVSKTPNGKKQFSSPVATELSTSTDSKYFELDSRNSLSLTHAHWGTANYYLSLLQVISHNNCVAPWHIHFTRTHTTIDHVSAAVCWSTCYAKLNVMNSLHLRCTATDAFNVFFLLSFD